MLQLLQQKAKGSKKGLALRCSLSLPVLHSLRKVDLRALVQTGFTDWELKPSRKGGRRETGGEDRANNPWAHPWHCFQLQHIQELVHIM